MSLHHFDSPAALFNQGDWLNRKTVDAYVRYAEFCFREFREVKNWFTINELISLSHSQYIQGNFPPNHHFDVTSGIQSQHNELGCPRPAPSTCIKVLTRPSTWADALAWSTS